jgi:hypothetical protein
MEKTPISEHNYPTMANLAEQHLPNTRNFVQVPGADYNLESELQETITYNQILNNLMKK